MFNKKTIKTWSNKRISYSQFRDAVENDPYAIELEKDFDDEIADGLLNTGVMSDQEYYDFLCDRYEEKYGESFYSVFYDDKETHCYEPIG